MLDEVRAAGGLSVRVVDDLLPLALPSVWSGPVSEDARLQVRLTVNDCDVAVRRWNRDVLRRQLSDGQASSEIQVTPGNFEEFLFRACPQA